MSTLRRTIKIEETLPPDTGDASSRAHRRMAEIHRMRLPSRPRFSQPTIPSDLDEVEDGLLMRLFRELTVWSAYTAGQLACAEIDERHAESEMEKQKALFVLQTKREQDDVVDGVKKPQSTVTEIKARAWESPEFLGAQEWYREAHDYRKLLQVVYDNCERFSSLVSRELTRRVNRDPTERRERRYSA